MFRIGVFEPLLGETAHIFLEVTVSLRTVNFDQEKTYLEGAESSEVLDLSLTGELVFETEYILMRGGKND